MIPKNAKISNTALLVIDVTNFCAHQDYEDLERGITYRKIRRMVPRLSSFITSYQQIGGAVMLINSVPWQEKYLSDNINELYRNDEDARYWSSDTTGQAEKFYKIPTEGALVFTKDSYDAFTSALLVDTLEKMKIQYVIVTGIFGDGCVLASVCGGFSKGYNFIIAKDLIETTDIEDRQLFQRYLFEKTWPFMYGPTVESQQILTHFS
jgi:nicotinamidase-related amidase